MSEDSAESPPQPEEPVSPPVYVPAGFWLRVWAYFMDVAILTAFYGVVEIVIPGDLAASLCTIVLWWGYFPIQEGSVWQATIGKRFFGLVVTTDRLEPVSLWRAIWRHIARSSPAFVMIGGFLVVFLPGVLGQRISAIGTLGAFGLIVLSALLALVQYPMAGYTSQKQALHDFIAHTYVHRRCELPFGAIAARASVALLAAVIAMAMQMVSSSRVTSSVNMKPIPDPCSQGRGQCPFEVPNEILPDRPKPTDAPLFRFTPKAIEAAPAKQKNRTNLSVVTIRPASSQEIVLEADRPLELGFELLPDARGRAVACENGCLEASSGSDKVKGREGTLVIPPVMKRIRMKLTNTTSSVLEVVVFRLE